MPRSGLNSTDELGIQLEDFRYWYRPGDTIIGNVTRKAAVDSSCVLKLTLFGRAKTKIDVHNGQRRSVYRGRAVLFSGVQVLHQGEITEDARFPFTVELPEASLPGVERRGDAWEKNNLYLATEDDVTKHKLPSSWYYKVGRGMGMTKAEAYVEYVLEAELTGAIGQTKASFPLFVRPPSTATPIQEHYLQGQSKFLHIKTPKLLPEFADTELTFRQKSRRFFRPSKTPRYGSLIRVEYPVVIQLGHPDPIPFSICLIPVSNPTWTTICPDGDLNRLPPIEFVSMTELNLTSCTRIRAPGSFVDHDSDKWQVYPFVFSSPITPFEIPVYPSPTDVVHTPSGPYPGRDPLPDRKFVPFPLGAHLQLSVDSGGTSTLGMPRVPFPDRATMHPSFNTYNVNLSWQLEWEFSVRCAGKTERIRGQSPVRVLPPSEEQEARRAQELGPEGRKKDYESMLVALDLFSQGVGLLGDVLEAFGE